MWVNRIVLFILLTIGGPISVRVSASQCSELVTPSQVARGPRNYGKVFETFRTAVLTWKEWRRIRAEEKNQAVLSKLDTIAISPRPNRVSEASLRQIGEIYEAVSSHPVGNLKNAPKYDPDGSMGFCFGRAMIAHLEALFSGINKQSIRKIWVYGDLRKYHWDYHVATLIKAVDNQWYAIDPILGRPVSVLEWYAEMRSYTPDGKVKIAITLPTILHTDKVYSLKTLSDKDYYGYFVDMLATYRQKAKQLLAQKRPTTPADLITSLNPRP